MQHHRTFVNDLVFDPPPEAVEDDLVCAFDAFMRPCRHQAPDGRFDEVEPWPVWSSTDQRFCTEVRITQPCLEERPT
jgi:hypothetical protein